MALPDPKPALLIRYSYLWWDESRSGAEEGRKDRPAVVVLVVQDADGRKTVLVAPVTHVPPREEGMGIEIPTATKARLGLDEERSWIVTTEVNQFEWPGPDLRHIGGDTEEFAYGYIPARLFEAVVLQIRANNRTVSQHMVPRSK